MSRLTRRIVFINIPHIWVESENLRRRLNPSISCIILSGTSPKGVVIDYSEELKNPSVKKGAFLKDIDISMGKINLLEVDYDYLDKINKEVISYLKNYSILVETNHYDEYYIDLTGTERLFGREIETCGKIIMDLKKKFGLSSKIGIGSNKLISYLSSKLAEIGAVYDIVQQSEALFLRPIKIELLPCVAMAVKTELHSDYGIIGIRELEPFSREDLESMFCNDALLLYNCSRNISKNYLTEKKTERVLTHELVISSENNEDKLIHEGFFGVIHELCRSMREENIAPRISDIKIIYQDDYIYTYHKRLLDPTFLEKKLYEDLIPYVRRALRRRTSIKRIVLSFSGFITPSFQLDLFRNAFRMLRLTRAFDGIQKRFGKKYIHYGV